MISFVPTVSAPGKRRHRSALIDWFRPYGQSDEPIPFESLVEYARDVAPAADAVPVVRCKDCRFLGDENLGLRNCDHYRGPMRVELDDFCSYGEKNATD